MADTPTDQPKQPEQESLVGQILAERYAVLGHLGSGGMSIVYKARHEMLKKMVAVKVLKESLATNKISLSRFHREAMAAASIGDPHIVDITDYGFTDRGDAFIVMEYLEGQSLRELLRKEGALDTGRCVSIMRQILKGLGAAHQQGIIHRDLKSDNVFLVPQDGHDFVKLLDFGISKVLQPIESETGEVSLTSTGVVMGTPQYIAPEQAHGIENVDHRADIYSLGVMLYEMLTGSLPFTGRAAIEILMKHIQDDPMPPSQRRPDLHIPEVLEQMTLKAMSKDPDDRFASTEEILRALPDPKSLPGGYTSGTLSAPPQPKTSSGLALPLILGAVILAASGVGLWFLRGDGQAKPAEPPTTLAAPLPGQPVKAPPDLRRPSPPADAAPAVDSAARITIRLTVRPARAQIFLQGRRVGVGQVSRDVPRGSAPLVFVVQAPGYQKQEVSVPTEQNLVHTVRLAPIRRKKAVTPLGVKKNPYKKSR